MPELIESIVYAWCDEIFEDWLLVDKDQNDFVPQIGRYYGVGLGRSGRENTMK